MTILLWLKLETTSFKYLVDGREQINQALDIEEIQGKYWNKLTIYILYKVNTTIMLIFPLR
jgi:hypothetical protein